MRRVHNSVAYLAELVIAIAIVLILMSKITYSDAGWILTLLFVLWQC